MNICKLLLTLRILGAGVLVTLADHQAHHIKSFFGLSMTALTFFIPIVVFYALVFLVKFYYPKKDELKSQGFISISKKLDRTQIGLVVLSLVVGIAQLLENKNITFRDCVEVGLTSAMILVAEVVLAIIVHILEWLKK